jgi:hypothetical protein
VPSAVGVTLHPPTTTAIPLPIRARQTSCSLMRASPSIVVACIALSGGGGRYPSLATAQEDTSAITNPFVSGCLRQKLGDQWKDLRVCTSNDDPRAMAQGLCQAPTFPSYLEIRITPGNWFSATALGWITQIILSEVLGVPASVEAGGYGQSRDFYDPQSRVGKSPYQGSLHTSLTCPRARAQSPLSPLLLLLALDYDYPARHTYLVYARSLKDADCRRASRSEDNYQPCAHFLPEGWGNPLTHILKDDIEPPQGVGILGTEAWYMTKFTAEEYPEFVSYHGMLQPDSRQKLAKAFKRPTTWGDYCQLVSSNNCTKPDEVALRAPADADEQDRMFVQGVYTGHFRYTEQNNCTLNNETCTGHIANYPCGWSSGMETNTYHLGIPLDPNNGPDGGPNGYSQSQLTEIWDAANATRSHLIMMWWQPEPLYQRYQGTDAEFQRVSRPPYTLQCAQAIEERDATRDECSPNITDRVGEPEEACEWPPEPLRKLIAANVAGVLEGSGIPEAERNPAYDVMRLFQMDELQLGQLFDLHESLQDPRDAVCSWLVDNFGFIETTMPVTFPRVVSGSNDSKLSKGVLALSIFTTLLVLLTAFAVYRNKEKASIKYAQLDFLFLLLTGALLVSVGSILTSLKASDAICVAAVWFVHFGYTLELVPLIIKVAALHTMMTSARRFRRVSIPRRSLYGKVVSVGFVIGICLAIWSAVDPPRQVSEYSLTDNLTPSGERMIDARIVEEEHYCSGGESDAWQFAGLGWNTLLLLCASVLAFQTRNIKEDFNESRTLAFLIYSHCVFVVWRICTHLLSDSLDGQTLRSLRGMLFAVDQIAGMLIYFIPKLFTPDIHEMSTGVDMHSAMARSQPKSGESGSVGFGNLSAKNSQSLSVDSGFLVKEDVAEAHPEPVEDNSGPTVETP